MRIFTKGIFALFFLFCSVSLSATNYYSTSDGDFITNIWSTVSHASPGTTTPDNSCDITITATDVIYIAHNVTTSCNITINGGGSIVILGGGSLSITGGANLSGNGSFIINTGGTMNVSGNLNVGGTGDMTINGTVNVGGSFINGSNNGNVICGTGSLNVAVGSPPAGWNDDNCNFIVLSVQLIRFSAEDLGDIIQLDWITGTEINNDYFFIERSSNGTIWERVCSVDGAGNSNIISYYKCFDEHPLPGLTYYRLGQVDFDSTVWRSPPLIVERTPGDAEVLVFPNPTDLSSPLLLSLNGFTDDKVEVALYDIAGRLMYSEEFEVNSMYLLLTLPIQSIPAAGTYLVQVKSFRHYYSRNIIVR
jgi:hypothetical protein